MNPLLRFVLAVVALIVPPAVVLVDRSPVAVGTVAVAVVALAVFFLLFAGVGAVLWLAAGLTAFWRVLSAGWRRSFDRAVA